MKRTRVLVVSLKGLNQGFWSHVGCSGQNAMLFGYQSIFLSALKEEITKNCSHSLF